MATDTKVSPTPSYQFGALERRGFVAGLRAGQLLTLALGALFLVSSLRSGRPVFVVASPLLALFGAFWPLSGRTAEQWAPLVVRHLWRRALGQTSWRSDLPEQGQRMGEEPWPHLPSHLGGLRLIEDKRPDGQRIGVARDGRTYTAVLSVRGQAFALCDSEEKARRLAGWGATLSGLAREGTPVRRLQWIERTSPGEDGELGRAARSALCLAADHPAARSYLDLVDAAGPATSAHEVYVSIQVDARRAARLVKASGGGDDGAIAVLVRELASVASSLASAEVTVEGVLSPRQLAKVIRTGFDPSARGPLARRAAVDPERAGVAPHGAWPMATAAPWSSYRADGAFHAVYWVEEWPRVPVRPDFLSPLLLGTRATRTVSLVIEPVGPARAVREVEAARMADLADEEIRRRAGFLSSARRRRQHEGVSRREEELADGHGDCRFSGYVAVAGKDLEELLSACGEVEQLAQQCRLSLRRLEGEQDVAFAATLPLCRGLR